MNVRGKFVRILEEFLVLFEVIIPTRSERAEEEHENQ
jgi:hypothetical protein